MTAPTPEFFPPLIFNAYKPVGMGSQDVVRHFKRFLPRGTFGKIGHFGTLDPFACGVLMVAVGGAARLNEFIHADLPKTYLAQGLLGVETATGDLEGKVLQKDETPYFRDHIGSFDQPFVAGVLKPFVGEYWQAPHVISAAKHEGKPLHEWAREGVEIRKEKVRRFIHHAEVVAWDFPRLTIRVTVSSGTYVRTLFAELAQALGTIGHLQTLEREAVGGVVSLQGIKVEHWPSGSESVSSLIPRGLRPEEVLPYPVVGIAAADLKNFMNGIAPALSLDGDKAWAQDSQGNLLGLLTRSESRWRVEINFAASLATLRGPGVRPPSSPG